MNDRNYGGVIWTNHALDRLRDRSISQGDAWVAFTKPDQSRRGESKDAWIYYKTFGTKRIEVVAKKNERGEWLILSVWEREIEQSQTYRKENWLFSLLRKLF